MLSVSMEAQTQKQEPCTHRLHRRPWYGAGESVFGATVSASVLSEFRGPGISVLDKSSGRSPAKNSLGSQCPSASKHQPCVLAHDSLRSGFHQVMKITGPFIWKAAFFLLKKCELFAAVSHSLTDDNGVRKNRVSFRLSLDV